MTLLGANVDEATRQQVEALNTRYIRAIDDDQLEAWPELFVENCLYRIVTRENFDRGFTLPLMECASRGMLIDRVTGYRRVNIYEPQRYTHLLSGLAIERIDASRVACRQNYLVIRTMVTGEMAIFSAGVYLDKVIFGESGARFEERIVVQASRRIDTLLVIPL
ncbi:MAG TPA: aromatic-ring-hydroxylating dioxygenase subunit beta [Stellaceae bacterium]|nr:aromatic-ring-hydroxylating dioxygenase subunit beta [Stellaceae bacterium]